jgi:hypothetical protein
MPISHCVTLNLFCQKCLAGAIASIDASNCFNGVAHNVTSIACQCLGIQIETLTCLLVTVQLMNFLLPLHCLWGFYWLLQDPQFHPPESFIYSSTGLLSRKWWHISILFTLCIVLVHVMYLSDHVTIMVRAISRSKV